MNPQVFTETAARAAIVSALVVSALPGILYLIFGSPAADVAALAAIPPWWLILTVPASAFALLLALYVLIARPRILAATGGAE